MALINTKEPETVAIQLAEALQRRVPGAEGVQVRDVDVPQSSGMSNDTVLFRASWTLDGQPVDRRLVARIAPTGPTLFPTHDLERDARVLDALHTHTAVPVPDVLFYESDSSLLGAPFVVLGHREGRAAPDDPPFTIEGWVMDLTPEERATMADNSLRALVAIHQVDWKAIGLSDLDHSTPTQSPLDVLLAELRSFFAWVVAGDRENPTVAAGLAWLEANRPSESGPTVLNWGDARFANLLIKPDLSVSAVLDWEMVGVGSPEVDLGWWIFMFRHHTEGLGVPAPEGFPSRDEIIERYQSLTGITTSNVHYYEVLAAARLAILTQRATSLLIDGGVLPADSPMLLNNPATNLLAALADLPSPGGGATSSPMTRGK